MTPFSILTRKVLLTLAGLVVVNDLVWLSPYNLLESCTAVAATSFILWFTGAVTILAPCVYWQSKVGGAIATIIAGYIAFAVTVAGIHCYDSPIFAAHGSMAHIVEAIWVGWSLAGGFALALTALFARWTIYRPLRPTEVAAEVKPFGKDPALIAALGYAPRATC